MPLWAQTRKPQRARPPQFKQDEFRGVFFDNAGATLRGTLPDSRAEVLVSPSGGSTAPVSGGSTLQASQDPQAWHNLITATALEDLVKGSKNRLDRVITTPAAFLGGGFKSTRREFSLQALLFAIIESYPTDEVRWKAMAPLVRERLARAASNSKVGSVQTYAEAKQRLGDLGELLNGSKLPGEAKSEVEWSTLMDRGPLMQLLEWANGEFVTPHSASETAFADNKMELSTYAQLVAILGKMAIQEEMPDANDDDYQGFAQDMINQAQQIIQAVESDNAEQARLAAGKLGQSCQDCHDNFR